MLKFHSCTAIVCGIFIAPLVWCLIATAQPAIAAPNPSNILKQPAIEVNISLGNAGNELKFFPDHLKFEAGKHYKLMLSNPSPSKHYFTDKDFADAIWTQKVDAGNVEIKGSIHELELRPGTKAEWVFVAIKPGNFPLRCTVPGHTEAGMKGVVAIE
jgi:uncharacterized cupredoxin-like copper-binding protein